MNKKQRVLAAIQRREVDRIPTSYRGLKFVSESLMRYFGIAQPDIFSINYTEHSHGLTYHALGINARLVRIEKYNYEYAAYVDPPLAGAVRASDIKPGFLVSKLDLFDYSHMVNMLYSQKEKAVTTQSNEIDYPLDELRSKDEFIAMGSFNSVFIICSYLRGMEQFLIDLLQNKKIAQRLIGEVGEFVLEFNRRELSSFGRDAEFYSSWDDVAGQRGMLFPPELFKEHFLPIYRELYENVKKYDLIIDYHCCGSIHEVLPMMIDIGIDIFDVAQTSARGMDIECIYERYGNKVCIHGGIDVQKLLISGKPEDVAREVDRIIDLWGSGGGLILAPAHEIEPETPKENILAIYDAVNRRYGGN